ncbi:MAG: hypothetical protein HZC36_01605 [Armatimonadetes bacterium]|nr:hypothetical protein [Armatimonadota bacterium]
MYVPPFVPQPTEIPGNVTTERYKVRLGFIRRVALCHFASAVLVAGLMRLPLPELSPEGPILSTFLVLLGMSALRTLARGNKWEPLASLALMPLLLPSLAASFVELGELGFPAWPLGVGLACALAYTLLCGRDLSFVGMFGTAWIASTAAIIVIGLLIGAAPMDAARYAVLNTAYLLYYVYDLGSLLSRRRLGEEAGAIVDLYRDIFNVLGYSIRSLRHWKRHSIWTK